MTVCNMSIEGGARAGMVAPDQTTVEYLRGRRYVATGKEFDALAARWLECRSDDGAKFDRSVTFDAATFAPQVTWGTNPGMVTDVLGSVPNPAEIGDKQQRETVERALTYMALLPGTIEDIKIDRVFIGSCTNSRLSDLKDAAGIVKGRKVAPTVHAMVVPGSQEVKADAIDHELLMRAVRKHAKDHR